MMEIMPGIAILISNMWLMVNIFKPCKSNLFSSGLWLVAALAMILI